MTAGIIEELHNQGWDGNIYSGDGLLEQIYMKYYYDQTLLDGFTW